MLDLGGSGGMGGSDCMSGTGGMDGSDRMSGTCGMGGSDRMGGTGCAERLLLAQALGLAMARRAADILGKHSAAVTRAASGGKRPDAAQFATDDAIFTAVLDAANECLGEFDARPADDRWCDALLELIQLAQLTAQAEVGQSAC